MQTLIWRSVILAWWQEASSSRPCRPRPEIIEFHVHRSALYGREYILMMRRLMRSTNMIFTQNLLNLRALYGHQHGYDCLMTLLNHLYCLLRCFSRSSCSLRISQRFCTWTVCMYLQDHGRGYVLFFISNFQCFAIIFFNVRYIEPTDENEKCV